MLFYAFPFLQEAIDIILHKRLSFGGNFLCGGGVHQVGQQEQFFVKVIDGGGFVVKIGFLIHIHLRRNVRMVHQTIVISAVGKSPGDADGADGIQPIRVLSTFPLQSGWNNRILSGIGNFPDDPADPLDGLGIDTLLRQKMAGIGFLRIGLWGELPVVHIVQKRCQLDGF